MNVGNFLVNENVGMGTTTRNILEGRQFRFLGVPSRVTVALVGDATTGTVVGDLVCTIYIGSTLVLQSGAVMTERGANQGAVIPDNIIGDAVGRAGDEITIEVQNTDAATDHSVRGSIRIVPI